MNFYGTGSSSYPDHSYIANYSGFLDNFLQVPSPALAIRPGPAGP